MDYSTIQLDKKSPEPLHLQLGRELRNRILLLPTGTMKPLLSERLLSEELCLCRSTVHMAYQALIDEGIACRRPDKSLITVPEARKLLHQPFPTIGVVINGDTFNSFVIENEYIPLFFLSGILDTASKLNLSISMLHLPDPDAADGEINPYLQNVVNHMSGIIHMGNRDFAEDHPLEKLLHFTSVPQVFISGWVDINGIGSVTASPEQGIREMVAQLKKLGHRSLGILTNGSNENYSPTSGHFRYEAASRIKVIQALLNENRFPAFPECSLYNIGDVEDMEGKLLEMKGRNALPDVFWCNGDKLASEAVQALQKLGLRIPGDISVVGYNCDEYFSRYQSLSTIKFPFYDLGCASVTMLHDLYRHGTTGDNLSVIIPTRFVVGSTVGECEKYGFTGEKTR